MECKTVLPAERHNGIDDMPRSSSIVTEHFEPNMAEIHVDERRSMSGFDRARDRLVHQPPCASDVADAPSCGSQIGGRSDIGVWTVSELGFAIPLGVIYSQ